MIAPPAVVVVAAAMVQPRGQGAAAASLRVVQSTGELVRPADVSPVLRNDRGDCNADGVLDGEDIQWLVAGTEVPNVWDCLGSSDPIRLLLWDLGSVDPNTGSNCDRPDPS